MLVQKHRSDSLYLRGAVYCFRWVIPTDLRPYLGIRELKRSLQTPSRRLATVRAQSLYCLIEELEQLRVDYQLGVINEDDFISGVRQARYSISSKSSLTQIEPEKLFHDALDSFVEYKDSTGLTD